MPIWTNLHGSDDSDDSDDPRRDYQSRRLHRASSSTSESTTSLRRRRRSRLASRSRSRHTASTFSSLSNAFEPIRPHYLMKRHGTTANPSPLLFEPDFNPQSWRNRHLVRSFHGSLVLCLHPSVDPPDVIKTDPCAVTEAWIDVKNSSNSKKINEAVAQALQKQFESLNARMKFKVYPDISSDEIEKSCISLRKMARGDRVLFYYNGHGVPKPTTNGELWVFSPDHNQYIPLSVTKIQGWLQSPTVYVWDCSAAGLLVSSFNNFAEKRDAVTRERYGSDENSQGYPRLYSECIQMAACLSDEQLPMCPELPADLFTSCLTSPIPMALRYHILTHTSVLPRPPVTLDVRIPGDAKDRRTPLGELNWILTSITDTIAWTTFPRPLFQRLYRSDLMVAALFRNYLLAERIMKTYNCTPNTHPPLPPTNTHPMWKSWDMALDNCLRQHPELLAEEQRILRAREEGLPEASIPPYNFQRSDFFKQHLQAFQVWSTFHGTCTPSLPPRDPEPNPPNPKAYIAPRRAPDELPIILQVLLSNAYRAQALHLICGFMDLGPWAVHLALVIGIFPYIQRLLEAPTQELRAPLIYIWSRIIALDESTRQDLYGTSRWTYFANALGDLRETAIIVDTDLARSLPNVMEHRAMCLFIISEVVRGNPQAQMAAASYSINGATPNNTLVTQQNLPQSVFDLTVLFLGADDFLLRQWAALCLAQLWSCSAAGSSEEIKTYALERDLNSHLVLMLGGDRSPEVRAACLYAIGTLLGAPVKEGERGGGGFGLWEGKRDIGAIFRMEMTLLTGVALTAKYDISPVVRKELVVVLSCGVHSYRGFFICCAWAYLSASILTHSDPPPQSAIYGWLERLKADGDGDEEGEQVETHRLLFASAFTIWTILVDLTLDPHDEVSQMARTVVDWIIAALKSSALGRLKASKAILDGIQIGVAPLSALPPEASRNYTPRSRVVSLKSDRSGTLPLSTEPSFGTSNLAQSSPSQRLDASQNTTSKVASTIKRTSSLANALVQYAFPGAEEYTMPSSASVYPALSSHQPSSGTKATELSHPPLPPGMTFIYQSPYSTAASASPHVLSNASRDTETDYDRLPERTVADYIEALVEEDYERLRLRRTGEAESPSTLRTGSDLRATLPLRSRFYDWAKEYFLEPQMREKESIETGSREFNNQMWRRQRNEGIIRETRVQASAATECQWDRRVCDLNAISGPALNFAFHSFDNYIAIANDRDKLSVWDWSRRERLYSFPIGSPSWSSITSLKWINEEAAAFLLAGTSDGVIRIYRSHDPLTESEPPRLITAFRALKSMANVSRGSGLITSWSQNEGTILVGGDSRLIQSWNAHSEQAERTITSGSDSMVTSLTFAPSQNQVFITSFGDGSFRLYDRRKEMPIVHTWLGQSEGGPGHYGWVHSINWQLWGNNDLLSASVDGEVRLWDLRNMQPLRQWYPYDPIGSRGQNHSPKLGCFDIHNQAGVFAATSALLSNSYRGISTVIHSSSSLSDHDRSASLGKITTITNLHGAPPRNNWNVGHVGLAFHPREMLLGVGSLDGHVTVYGARLDSINIFDETDYDG